MTGMTAVVAALLAAPLSKCRITIISEYPSTVLIVSANQATISEPHYKETTLRESWMNDQNDIYLPVSPPLLQMKIP